MKYLITLVLILLGIFGIVFIALSSGRHPEEGIYFFEAFAPPLLILVITLGVSGCIYQIWAGGTK